ncbi:MAG: hypothetical protein ACYDCO_03020 [Armatimonadota bacterium]
MARDARAYETVINNPVKKAALDEKKARALAEGYLQKAGLVLDNLQLARNTSFCVRKEKEITYWIVSYSRTYQGLPFLQDGAVTMLNPRDGTLIGFTNRETCPLPKTTELRLTAEQVKAAADAYLFAKEQVHAETMDEPKGVISTRMNDTTRQRESFLCWQIEVHWGNGKHTRGYTIEDETGTVLGTYLTVNDNTR